MSVYTITPVTDFTIFTTPPARRKPTPFKASWSTTLDDLARELEHLNASDVVLELDVQPGKIRRDGMLYADAKVGHPGVRVSFQTRKHGALSYTCDTYESRWAHQGPDWQANVRAIVLTLEALRAVDRYGATKGEQYAGFKALPSGDGQAPAGGMTKDQAMTLIYEISGADVYKAPEVAFRRARARTHPDHNDGAREDWDRVEQAGLMLGYIQ